MSGLTPSERRGAGVLAIVLAIGTLTDLYHAHAPGRLPPPERPASAASVPSDSRAGGPEGSKVSARAPAVPATVDLDSATVADLDRLPGIGPVLAARIVEHRRLNGRFRRVDDLLLVPGIGPRLLERLRPYLREPTQPGASQGPQRAFRTP